MWRSDKCYSREGERACDKFLDLDVAESGEADPFRDGRTSDFKRETVSNKTQYYDN
jgi:hypothetical protein